MEKVLAAIEEVRVNLGRDIQFINQQIDCYRHEADEGLISVGQFRRRHASCKIQLDRTRLRIDALNQCSEVIVNLLKNE